MSQDGEHLRLLAIFHYVVASLSALFSFFPVIHLVIGVGIVTGRLDATNRDPGAVLFGWVFIFFALAFILCGLAFSACLAFSGRYLASYRRHTYCLVMAACSCIFFPFGTVLGVFTIIVRSRDSVKRLFQQKPLPSEVN